MRKNIQTVVYLSLISLVMSMVTTHCYAGTMSSQLQRYFNSVGGGSNATAPSTYKNQAAGYYNGGSFYGRVPVQSAQLAHIQMPGFRAGCGGIDAWTGGFSHISSEQLMGAMRQIMGNMGSFGFKLALASISPEISTVLDDLSALAQKINGLNINTCEAAATALGGMLPQSDATSKHLCQAMGTSYAGLSDWTAARHECGVGGGRSRILDNEHEAIKDTFKDQFNLVWQAIQKNNFLSSNKNLAELFMTLAGTLIVRRDGEEYQTVHLKSRAIDQQFIKAIVQGGNVQLYQCGAEEKCLNPTLGTAESISVNAGSLMGRVQTMLTAIVEKIYNDTALTQAEQGFLTGTTLPVYKILNVLTAYKKGHAPIEINSYAELIAFDILNHFLLEVLDIVEESISHLRKAQVSDASIREYLASLQQVRLLIVNERESAMAHMNATLAMIKSIQMVEKQLHVYLGTVSNANENNWS
jgi:conjugative transfer pilus assembly protein TraH